MGTFCLVAGLIVVSVVSAGAERFLEASSAAGDASVVDDGDDNTADEASGVDEKGTVVVVFGFSS